MRFLQESHCPTHYSQGASLPPRPGAHMSGGCRVLTLPAYSRLSSFGIRTGSPSCRSSLWMVQDRAVEEDISTGPWIHPPTIPSLGSGCLFLTQGGALLCAELYTGFFLFFFLIREAGVILVKLKVILHSKALQQPAHRPPLALGGRPQGSEEDAGRVQTPH